jgi:hypothetical protein
LRFRIFRAPCVGGRVCDYWDVRVRSADRQWVVDVIRLALTGTHRDREWLRIKRWGWHVADVRTVAEVAQYVDLATLEEALACAAW